MIMQLTEKIASIDDEHKRFDNVAKRAFPNLSLSLINKAIRKGDLRLNNQKVKGSEPIYCDDIISYKGFLQDEDKASTKAVDHLIPLSILFESNHLLALNKEAGRLVHGGALSLEQGVRDYLAISRSLSFRPGPCHRLDRNSSGIIVFAKTAVGARLFTDAIQNNGLTKEYLALVVGKVSKEAVWEHQLEREDNITFVATTGGKYAQTLVSPIAYSTGATLLRCLLKTGRTHQIRAQAAAMGHPLVGDNKYGGGPGGYFLHAYKLSTQQDNLFPPLTAALPANFTKKLDSKAISVTT